jgi:hypothetical protein
MAILFRADGTTLRVSPAKGKKFTLPELHKAVGGYIELVPTRLDNRHMFVNEDGRRLGLAVNEKATALQLDSYLAAGNVIVGDAILMGPGEDD